MSNPFERRMAQMRNRALIAQGEEPILTPQQRRNQEMLTARGIADQLHAERSGVTPRPVDAGRYDQFSSSGTPTGTAIASPISIGSTMSGLFSKAGLGTNVAGALGSVIGSAAGSPDRSIVPIGGKGGGAVAPSAPAATQGSFAPLTPSGGFNVNQAAAGALQQAMMGTQAGMGFQAPRTTAFGYTPAQRRAFTLAGSDIAQYESPYQQAVIDRTLEDLSSAQEKALNVLGQQATAARAFGGSRQGIAEAETRRKYAQQAAETVANLRERGFQQAMGAAQFDVGQLAGTEAANVAAQTAAAQFGATAAQQAQQQNFANQLAAQQQRMGAAQQLAGLGQQAFGIGQTIQQQQAQQGLLQQGLQQALIDAARGQYAGYVGSPSAALQAPLAALGVTPVPKTTTQGYSPGLFDYLKYPLMGLAR